MPSIIRKRDKKNLGGITPANLNLDPSLKHFGPFNKVSNEVQKDPTDEAARQHDIEYGKLGNQAYFRHNQADEQFIKDTEKDPRFIVQAGRKYFQAKKAISNALGTTMSNKRPYKRAALQNKLIKNNKAPPTPPPSPKQFKASESTNLPMQVDHPQAAALGSATSDNPGSGSALGSHADGIEVIPGHQKDDMGGNKTLRSSNSFRVYYANTASWGVVNLTTRNACASGPNVDYNQNDTEDASNTMTQIDTDWCYLPNNKLDLYVTPAQMSKFIMGGAIGYRVKKCGFKLYGIYNMNSYQSANTTFQGMEPAYGVIIEPNSIYPIPNQIGAGERVTQLNPNAAQDNFNYGDPFDMIKLQTGTAVAAKSQLNYLRPASYCIPYTLSDTSNTQDVINNTVADLTRHSQTTIIRNGDEFSWSWHNPDKRYINIYNPNYIDFASTTEENVRNFWPMQILDTEYQALTAQPWQGSLDANSRIWRNQNLHYTGGPQYPEMPPVLFKIPQLKQWASNATAPNFEMYMYIDYNIEIEFQYGDYTKIRNGPYCNGPYGAWNSGGFGAVKIQEALGNLRTHKYTASVKDLTVRQNNNPGYTQIYMNNPPQQQAQSFTTSAWDYSPTAPALLVSEKAAEKTIENRKAKIEEERQETINSLINDYPQVKKELRAVASDYDAEEIKKSFEAYKKNRPKKI